MSELLQLHTGTVLISLAVTLQAKERGTLVAMHPVDGLTKPVQVGHQHTYQ
jgi:hypothetical protein